MHFGNWSWLVVGGCPRSGTTLLNFLLNSHPAIRLTNENNFARLIDQVGQLFYREQRLPSVPDRLKGPNENWRREDVERATLQFDKCAVPVLKALYTAHFGDQVCFDQVAYFGDKLPCYYDRDWDRVQDFIKPMKVIHVSRDPRDVVNSMLRRAHNTRQGKDYWHSLSTPEQACYEWARGWNFIVAERRQPKDVDYLHIKYEDFVDEPDRELARLCEFLQVEDQFDRSSIIYQARSEREMLDDRRQARIAELLPGIVEDWAAPLMELEQRYPAFPLNPPAGGVAESIAVPARSRPKRLARRMQQLVWTAFRGEPARSK